MKYLIYAISLIAVFAVWEFYGSNSQTVRIFISTPSLSAKYLISHLDSLSEATFTTSLESVLGLVIATFFSVVFMIFCLYIPKMMDIILPIFITSQVIPIITLAPLFVLLFGMGVSSKIAMAALMCFFPIFVNFASGIATISTSIKELLFIYNTPISFKIFKVYFPLSLPNFFTGLKISSTLAVIGAIVAEFNGAESGIGKNLYIAAKKLDAELMICSIIISTLLGGLFYLGILILEKIFGKWYLQTNKII